MTEENFDGLTNYQTWLVGKWFDNSFDEDERQILDADDYRDEVFTKAFEGIQFDPSFLDDVLHRFLEQVNFAELADRIRTHEEDYPAIDGFGCRCGEGEDA